MTVINVKNRGMTQFKKKSHNEWRTRKHASGTTMMKSATTFQYELTLLNKKAKRERWGAGTRLAMPIYPPHHPDSHKVSQSQH